MISDKSQTFYNKLAARRRGWEVITPTQQQKCVEGSEATLSKALALSVLELPVGEWITEEIEKNSDLPSDLVTLLKLNAADEVKHDAVLNNLKKVFNVREEDEKQALEFANEANVLASRYSPVTLAGALESSIFFVALPMYRFMGDAAFRSVSRDISNDETIHAAVNNQLARDLDYRRGKKVNDLRQEIMDWLVADLPTTHENPQMTQDFWQRSSVNLYNEGKTNTLKSSRRAVMPSFFETSNNDLQVYG